MDNVLFACTHNAGRSQMASAVFNRLADPARARATSAGTAPAARVHAGVATVMAEIGIDVGHATPRLLTEDLARAATLFVTMGCGESCPYVPGLETVDWDLPDPKDRPLPEVRALREDIRARVADLVATRGWAIRP